MLYSAVTTPLWAVAVDEKKLDDPVKEQMARDLMKEVRCLVCQNQSIEDSNADLAKDLRGIVRQQIGAGKSPDEVKEFLVARYGDWVLLKPPIKGGTLFLWGSPLLFLLVIVAFIIFRRKDVQDISELSKSEKARLSDLLGKKDKNQ
jgi:cytochrome c-type biogenesis protein CcmH